MRDSGEACGAPPQALFRARRIFLYQTLLPFAAVGCGPGPSLSLSLSLGHARRSAAQPPALHECARSHPPDWSTWRLHNHRCISIQESQPQLYIDAAVLSLSRSRSRSRHREGLYPTCFRPPLGPLRSPRGRLGHFLVSILAAWEAQVQARQPRPAMPVPTRTQIPTRTGTPRGPLKSEMKCFKPRWGS